MYIDKDGSTKTLTINTNSNLHTTSSVDSIAINRSGVATIGETHPNRLYGSLIQSDGTASFLSNDLSQKQGTINKISFAHHKKSEQKKATPDIGPGILHPLASNNHADHNSFG